MGRWLELLGHPRVPTGLAAAAKGRAASLCNLASAGRSGSCNAAVLFKKKLVTFLQGLHSAHYFHRVSIEMVEF